MTDAHGNTLRVTKADWAQGGQGHSAVALGAQVSGNLALCEHLLSRGTWAQELRKACEVSGRPLGRIHCTSDLSTLQVDFYLTEFGDILMLLQSSITQLATY